MLSIEPCIPRSWPGYRIDYRRGSTRYEIAVDNPEGVNRGVVSVELDGIVIDGPDAAIPLDDDGGNHSVRVVMGTSDDGSPRRRAGPAATSSPSEPSRKGSGVAATDIRPV
jgi:cyclic beta-1,2-glucan synthetase